MYIFPQPVKRQSVFLPYLSWLFFFSLPYRVILMGNSVHLLSLFFSITENEEIKWDLQGPRELRNSLLFCNLGPQLLSVLVHLWMRGLSIWEWGGYPSPFMSFTGSIASLVGLLLTSLDLLSPCCSNSVWYRQSCCWWLLGVGWGWGWGGVERWGGPHVQ